MRLKSFYAKTMKEAMQMVRDTLGEDAIIVATREENGGKSVRVTAAVEYDDAFEDGQFEERNIDERDFDDHDDYAAPNFEVEAESDFTDDDDEASWLQYDEEEEQSAVAEELTDIMLRHSVPEDILDQIITCATVMGVDQTEIALIAALEHLFNFKPLPQKRTAAALMMVGPPGAGKTLATAKLATRAVMAGHKVAVLTTDSQRAGGAEQLSAFTKILRVPMTKIDNPRQLQQALNVVGGVDQIFIDTAGLNPFSQAEMRELARMTGAGDIEPILVMPAGIDADESGDIGKAYGAIGVKSFIPTRLDMTRRLGGILSAAYHGGLSFAEGSHTSKVADGLFTMTPKRLAGLLMPQSLRSEPAAKPTEPEKTVKKTETPTRKKQTANAGH